MADRRIQSAAEPWIVLPLTYMESATGSISEYSSRTCAQAINDVISNMQGGRSAYDSLIRKFVMGIYEELADIKSPYFLDKTPRYYFIIPQILRIFPDAKFIFLFRNPADVYASILSTWNGATFKRIWAHWTDLHEGPSLLSIGFQLAGCRAHALSYESLVDDPIETIREIYAYLKLDFHETHTHRLSEILPKGRKGDTTGPSKYQSVSRNSIDNWKKVFNNRFRKYVLFNYIKKLPESVLLVQGYSRSRLLNSIKQESPDCDGCLVDMFFYFRAKLIRLVHAEIFLSRRMRWARRKYLS